VSRIRALVFAAFAVLLTTGLVACGGGGGGGSSEDPQKVLDQTFSGQHDIKSGKLDVSFSVDAKGKSGGSFEAKLGGPFQSVGDTQLPKLDLTASVSGSGSGQSLSFEGGLTSTGDRGFVNYKGTDYEVPASTFDQVKGQYESQAKTAKKQQQSKLDVHPETWLTNLKNEGTEDVNGASAIHISGDGDVSKVVEDLKKVVEQAGRANVPAGTPVPDASQIDQLKNAVKEAHFDVFTGADDKILRKLDATLKVDSNGSTADIRFSVGFADLNKPQTISAPTKTKPLTELLGQLGLGGGLGALGGIGGSSSSSSSGSGSAGGAGGQPSGGPSNAQSQKYLDCLQKAKDQAAIQQCASQLGQ
jgi:hypothetical protein